MSFIVSFGKYGGFYFRRDYATRLCLGWLALTFLPCDIDDAFTRQHDTVLKLSNIIDDLSRSMRQ